MIQTTVTNRGGEKPRDPITWSGANPGGRIRLPESEQLEEKKMIKLGKKTTATLLIATFMISIFTVAMPVIAQTKPTIDGVIGSGEWGEVDFSGTDYGVYLLNDADYLYVAFEATGGDFTIASSMTNIYIYAGDDYAGECWAYCVAGWVGDIGLDYFTIHHIQPTKVKLGKVPLTTNAEVSISTTVMEWKIPLSEFPMNPGDTIAFDFMSFSEGSSSWSTAWLYEQYYTLELPPDTTPPTIADVNVDPIIVERGDYLTITATVTDDVGVVAVSADFSYNPEYTDRPTPTSVRMIKGTGDTYAVVYQVPEDWRLGEMIIKVAARDAENWIRSVESVTVTVVVPIEATVDINPDTLNLKSNGQYITAYIELPGEYSVGAIDVATILLKHGEDLTLDALWGEVQDGVFMVKFDRIALREHLADAEDLGLSGVAKFLVASLKVKGKLTDGMPFEASDTIQVLKR